MSREAIRKGQLQRRELNKFWISIGRKFYQLGLKYPTLMAQRKANVGGSPGEWFFLGPYDAIHSYKLLAIEAAKKSGFSGTDEMAVQFWLDQSHGDHLIMKSPTPRKDDTKVAVTIDSDGRRRGYSGRQEIG